MSKKHGRCHNDSRTWTHHPFEICLPGSADADAEALFDSLATELEHRDIIAG